VKNRSTFSVIFAGFCALWLSGCQRPSPSGSDGSAAVQPAPPGVEAEAGTAAESAALVGPGATAAEAIEVVDEGPPAPMVFFTSGLLGYTEPCGCTIDLVLGGIDRIVGYVQAAKALAPAALVVDAGNLLFEHETLAPQDVAQEVRKTRVLMLAHAEMGTVATTVGPMDLANGLTFYLDTVGGTDITILSVNVSTASGSPIGLPHMTVPVGEEVIGLIGASDPALFAGITDVQVADPLPGIEASLQALAESGATTTVLLYQGDLASARQRLAAVEGLDFIVPGYHPRRTDEVTQVGGAWVLEAYDQGRTVGRLKLVTHERGASWTNARVGSSEEQARLDRLIESTEVQLQALEVPEGSDVPPIVVRQQERLAQMRQQREAMTDTLDFGTEGRRFLYRPIDMEPGLPVSGVLTEAMVVYNQELQAINMATISAPLPAEPGQPHYVGDTECQRCHLSEQDFWLTTQHAHAMETLTQRNKHFDRNCVGCHVTGWELPGGSALGHTEGLENVQCEQCHGPGSLHISNPSLNNVPGGVQVAVPESTCVGCHNSEHSPRFDYDTYLTRVIGPGHGQP
jgi:hypothetical protein